MKISVQSRAPRYKGKVPVKLESCKGVTRDFNGAGIFFEMDRSFSPGQSIEFSIVMEHIDALGPVKDKLIWASQQVRRSRYLIPAYPECIAAEYNEVSYSSIGGIKY